MGACAPNAVHGLGLGVSSLWTQVGSEHYARAQTLPEVQEPILEPAEEEARLTKGRRTSSSELFARCAIGQLRDHFFVCQEIVLLILYGHLNCILNRLIRLRHQFSRSASEL